MKPTKAEIGVNSMTSAPNIIKKNITIAQTSVDNLLLPPYSTFILLYPNSPPPPSEFVHPQKKLEVP